MDSLPSPQSIPTHHRFQNLTGEQYGRLTVLYYAGRRGKATMWVCECECGTRRVVYAGNLRCGYTKSCGCLQKEEAIRANLTHGLSNTFEHRIWRAMKERCCNPNDKAYKRYGGRGITICDRWRYSFQNFIADMGFRPADKNSIDRVDNSGNYEPSNCRWATYMEQAHNKG